MFESAKWIACPDRQNENGSYFLRKEFAVDKSIKKAVLYVCGLGLGEYTINGKNVTEDVLTTPFTKYDSRVYYNKYDVTNYIQIGRNAIGAYLGNGFYNDKNDIWEFSMAPWHHHPKLLLELIITYENKREEKIVSDGSWKSVRGACVYNHMREGECFDNRLNPKHWRKPYFDDNDWYNVFICRPPGGKLEENIYPAIQKIKFLYAKKIADDIYDFGENTSGFIHVKGSANSGHELIIEYSERIVDGDIDTKNINLFNKNELRHTDKYIFSGDGIEEWEPSFCYHGFRYVKITNAPEDLEVYAVTVHTNLKIIGEFETDNIMINKIHNACCRSTLTNFHGIPTDCPHREQNGWTGDAQWSASQALMNYDIYESYYKWMLDFKDVQRPNGQLPGIVPSGGWGFNWGSGPAWDSALFIIPWEAYISTGNKKILSAVYDNMRLYLEFANAMTVDNIADFGLPDWCAADNSNVCPRPVTDTAYYYHCCKLMVEISNALGYESKRYLEKSYEIKKSFTKNFISDEKLFNNQTFLAVCIYFDLVPDGKITEYAKRLAEITEQNGNHIVGGTIAAKCIFSALADNGYNDILYKCVTNPEYPSYAYWINNGMTTICENWDMSSSLNHHMFSEVDYWFYKYIAGINIRLNEIVISPIKTKGINYVKAKHKDISVEIKENTLCVEVPSEAKVIWKGNVYKTSAGKYTFN